MVQTFFVFSVDAGNEMVPLTSMEPKKVRGKGKPQGSGAGRGSGGRDVVEKDGVTGGESRQNGRIRQEP